MPNQLELFTRSLYHASRAWGVEVSRRIKPSSGLSQAAWFTLASISRREEPASQIDLAKELNIEAASMVAMLDRLVKMQLVQRVPCERDRRVKKISLTEQGNSLFAEVREDAQQIREEILGDIDPQKLQIALEVMQQLQDNIAKANTKNEKI
jgi:MarR family transcriptional regulator for hemolysin